MLGKVLAGLFLLVALRADIAVAQPATQGWNAEGFHDVL